MTRRRPFSTFVLLGAAFVALTALSCGRVPLPPADLDDGSPPDTQAACDALSYQAAYVVGEFSRNHLDCTSDADCAYLDAPACTHGCWQAINAASIMPALVAAEDACRAFDAMGCVTVPTTCVSATGPRAVCQAGVCGVANLPGG